MPCGGCEPLLCVAFSAFLSGVVCLHPGISFQILPPIFCGISAQVCNALLFLLRGHFPAVWILPKTIRIQCVALNGAKLYFVRAAAAAIQALSRMALMGVNFFSSMVFTSFLCSPPSRPHKAGAVAIAYIFLQAAGLPFDTPQQSDHGRQWPFSRLRTASTCSGGSAFAASWCSLPKGA